MKTAQDVLKMIKDKDVKFVDLRFTDPRGKRQHVTVRRLARRRRDLRRRHHVRRLLDRRLEGDRRVRHDADAGPGHRDIDPFFAQTTMAIFCDVLEPSTGELYERDPRAIAKKAEAYVKSTGVGDTRLLRPGGRVLHLRRRASSRPIRTTRASSSTAVELPTNTDTDYEMGNLGHRVRTKGGYFPVPPVDSAQDIRSEMLVGHGRDGRRRREAPPRGGLRPARARHQVRPADADGRPHADLQVRDPQGRPGLRQDRDLHAEADLRRQRLGHALPPVDLEGRQAGVRRQQVRRPLRRPACTTSAASSSTPRRINAFTNPTTNSYKRLVPGYEAPVLLAYSARNRSASCRIPLRHQPEGQARRGPLPRSGAPTPTSPSRRC